MKAFMIICGLLLLIAIADLPIGYFTFLRIIVSVGAVVVLVRELANGISFWVIIFGLIAVTFNPIFPVYLNDKAAWMPIDVICGLIFLTKGFTYKQ